MTKSCVIFDLDGTLCELGDSANPYNHSGEEVIRPDIYEELVKEWYPLQVDIIILTGRKEKDYGAITRVARSSRHYLRATHHARMKHGGEK